MGVRRCLGNEKRNWRVMYMGGSIFVEMRKELVVGGRKI